jgi:hypothetical protein
VAAIRGRKRIFRRAGWKAKRIDVNLTTFGPRTKKKMSLERDSFKVGRSRVWRGWERSFQVRKFGPVLGEFWEFAPRRPRVRGSAGKRRVSVQKRERPETVRSSRHKTVFPHLRAAGATSGIIL